jgi:hypothetical protein
MRYLERATVRMLGVLICMIGLGLVGCGGDDDEETVPETAIPGEGVCY